MSEQHAVFLTLADGSKVRVSAWLGWDQAQSVWTSLDDQRRAHLVTVDSKPIRHYEVRSENDPAYKGLREISGVTVEVLTKDNYKTPDEAAKVTLEALGYKGKKGGWIYVAGQPVAQGWWNTARKIGRPVTQAKGERRYRGTISRRWVGRAGIVREW